MIKKKLKEDLSIQLPNGHIENFKKGDELDILSEATTPLHYFVVFNIEDSEYIDKEYFED